MAIGRECRRVSAPREGYPVHSSPPNQRPGGAIRVVDFSSMGMIQRSFNDTGTSSPLSLGYRVGKNFCEGDLNSRQSPTRTRVPSSPCGNIVPSLAVAVYIYIISFYWVSSVDLRMILVTDCCTCPAQRVDRGMYYGSCIFCNPVYFIEVSESRSSSHAAAAPRAAPPAYTAPPQAR